MVKNIFQKIISSVISIALIGATFSLGYYYGMKKVDPAEKVSNVTNKETLETPLTVDFGPFWTTWNLLNEKYVGGVQEITDQDRVWGAIQGLASSLEDPYTVFMPPTESKMFNEDIKGNFSGVGMEIGVRDGILTVVAPLKDTPAERAGIKSGDQIIKIDGKMTNTIGIDKAVKLIRGEEGTEVKLVIARKGEEDLIELGVVRGNIEIPTINTEKKGDVFIISLYNFSAVSPNLFQKALREFIEADTNKLILDLRGNPGGYLEAAVDMASWFLPTGKIVVSEDYKGESSDKIHRSKGYNIFNKNLKFVILVNGGSASASEILAGALQEHGVATIVGEQSFGKGSVQELIPVTPETSLKVTVARWLTPNGNSISENGLTPDIEVKMTKEDFEEGKDPQLEKAIQILSE